VTHEKYFKRELKKWYGDTPVYSQQLDKYFFDVGELDDEIHDEELYGEELELVLCDLVIPRLMDSDYWYDELDEEDTGTFKKLDALCDEFNAKLKTIFSNTWEPGKYRVEYEVTT